MTVTEFDFEGLTPFEKIRKRSKGFCSAASHAHGLSFKPRSTDVFITTFPKCGTTWVTQICHQLRTGGHSDFGEITEVVPWDVLAQDMNQDLDADQIAEPRLFKSHEAAWHIAQGGKYIHVSRRPEDALMSFYKFLPGYNGVDPNSFTFEEFVDENFHMGADVWNFFLSWFEKKDDPNVLWVCYEDLHSDFAGQVGRIADFMGINLTPELLELVRDRSSFKYMEENSSQFDDHWIFNARIEHMGVPVEERKWKIAKVRTGGGKVGGGSLMTDSLREKMAKSWSEKIGAKTGLANYDEMRDKASQATTIASGSSSDGSMSVLEVVKESMAGFVTEESVTLGRTFTPRKTDIFITTYPKCGTTWVTQICHQLRTGRQGGHMDFGEITQVVPWEIFCKDLGQDIDADQVANPRLFKSHENAWDIAKGGKYIHVCRRPEDALMSLYRFLPGNCGINYTDIPLDDFVEGHMWHTEPWDFFRSWWELRHDPNVLWICYEDLREDLEGQVRLIAKFMEIELDDDILKLVLDMASFKYMEAHGNQFDDHWLLNIRRESMKVSEENAKHRTGKVRPGGGKSGEGKHMSERAMKFIDDHWRTEFAAKTGLETYDDLRAAVRVLQAASLGREDPIAARTLLHHHRAPPVHGDDAQKPLPTTAASATAAAAGAGAEAAPAPAAVPAL